MSAAFPEVTLDYSSVSPQLADGVQENLQFFAKVNKLFIELVQKFISIQNEMANMLLTSSDNFSKRLTELLKSCKGKVDCQSESYVRFFFRVLEQMDYQGKVLHNVNKSMNDCVVNPINENIEIKKNVWKTCYHYADSFYEQIKEKEEDLTKRYRDYSDAALKCSKAGSAAGEKQKRIMDNTHNTYLLRLSSVNSMNQLLYKHVLPHVLFGIKKNQNELNDSLRHHIKYMLSIQKETFRKFIKSYDELDQASSKIDIVTDLRKFIKVTSKEKITDKSFPVHEFMPPAAENKRASVAVSKSNPGFILNKFTHPNLQRRLVSLQHQTSQLVDAISSIRSGENNQVDSFVQTNDPTFRYIVELLIVCDKEANLNVLLKQMELYSPEVLDFLGPAPDDLINESRKSKRLPNLNQTDTNQRAHAFIVSKLMKPTSCSYCGKLMSFINKPLLCKVCKVCVHKKCSVDVPFCEGYEVKEKNERKFSQTSVDIPVQSSVVFDLIDFDSDDGFDSDEFDSSGDEEGEECYINSNYSTSQNVASPVVTNKDQREIRRSSAIKMPSNPMQELNSVLNSSKPLSRLSSAPAPALKAKPNHCETKTPTQMLPKPITPIKPVLAPKPSQNKPAVSKKPSNSTKSVSNEQVKPKKQIPPALPSRPDLHTFCVAIYDFRSEDPGNLSFLAGTKIQVTDKSDQSWWAGTLNGFNGYFPAQYVIPLKENERPLRCLYDFHAEDTKELSVFENEIVVLICEEADWYSVKSNNGKGLIPAAYVEFI